MDTQRESGEQRLEWPRLSPLSSVQWETVEEVEDLLYPSEGLACAGARAARTPCEIEREIVRDVFELKSLFSQPHHPDGAMATEMLEVSDDLREAVQDEILDDGFVLWRGFPRRFGRRPLSAPES